LLLQLGAGLVLCWQALFASSRATTHFIDGGVLAGLCLAIAGLTSAYFLQSKRQTLRDWEREFYLLPYLWGLVWWSASWLGQLDLWLPAARRWMGLALAAAGSAVLAHALAQRIGWPLLRRTTLGLLPVLGLLGLGAIFALAHPLGHGGWLAWPLALAALFWLLYQLEGELPPPLLGACQAASLWLVLALAGSEAAYWLARAASGESWRLIGWALPALLTLAWLHSPPRRWPFNTYSGDYQRLGLGGLALALGLWLLHANLTRRGDAAPLPYLPLLNPLDITQALVLLAVFRWWRGLTAPAWAARIGNALIAAAAFLGLHGVVVRSVHQWADVPFRSSAMLASTTFQTCLSLLWSVVALVCMSFATRHRLREAWFVGAALIAAVVAKLFLVDLDGSNTLARIVSFLGVGLLLLIIGYLAPLPPARAEESQA
jgi:uncharacterized membrane protein